MAQELQESGSVESPGLALVLIPEIFLLRLEVAYPGCRVAYVFFGVWDPFMLPLSPTSVCFIPRGCSTA